jgi:hypothetical protein
MFAASPVLDGPSKYAYTYWHGPRTHVMGTLLKT